MKYVFDLRFIDRDRFSKVHFLSFFTVKDEIEGEKMRTELFSGFLRNNVEKPSLFCRRIDNDPALAQKYEGDYLHFLSMTTAKISIEQYILREPDQRKNLWDNLVSQLKIGSEAKATIGKKYIQPIIARDLETLNPITDDFDYFTVEHLIPKENMN